MNWLLTQQVCRVCVPRKTFEIFLLVVGQISLFHFLYRSLVFQFKFFTHRYTNEQHLNYVYLQIFAFCFGMLCLMPGFSNKIMLRHLYFLWQPSTYARMHPYINVIFNITQPIFVHISRFKVINYFTRELKNGRENVNKRYL